MSHTVNNSTPDGPLPWMAEAACSSNLADPEWFFAEGREDRRAIVAAKEVCEHCIVRQECLIYALKKDEEYGIWGGMTADQRRNLVRHYRRRSQL